MVGGDEEHGDWLIDAVHVRKKYCRDLRRSLWYALKDVAGAFTTRNGSEGALREHEFWAVDDVSFELRRGDALGLLGVNGAGKSTLLKLVTGQRRLSDGSIRTRGRMVALTELGLGFAPVLSGRENAYINAAVHGIPRGQFDKVIEDVIEFSGIREFIDSAVQTYSSGMKARLGFSVATHLNPDILIVDEVLSVGDLDFKRKCIQHILNYIKNGGSVLLVSHEPYLVQSICNRCIVLERGRVVFEGTAVEGVSKHFQITRKKNQTSLEAAEQVLGEFARDGLQPAMAEVALLDGVSDESYVDPELTAEKPVAIDRIEVVGSDGGAVRTGTSVDVRMIYRSMQSAEVLWGFELLTSDLRISLAAFSKGMDGTYSRLKKGRHMLVCRIAKFPFHAGTYGARGGIGEAETKAGLALIGYEDRPQFFTVAAPEVSHSQNFKMAMNALLDLESEFLS